VSFGERVRQPGGHESYVPVSLSEFDVELEPLVRANSDAARALARLDAATELLPNPDLFVRMYVRKEALFEQPAVTVRQVQEIIDMSYQVANKLVGDFERLGLLEEVTGQKRNRRYRYQPYLEIFGELSP